MHFSFLTVTALVAGAFALPSVNHLVHEKRERLPPGWQYHEKLQSSEVLPMSIALTQSNLDKADDFLMEVSHPESPNFGKHWTHEEIANKFAPSSETVDTVKAWVVSSGIAPERISRSQSLGWLKFDATVAEAETLLRTEYHLYKHETGKPHVACSSYHIPEHVAPHVDFITPTVHFDTKIPQAAVKDVEKRAPSTTAAAGHPVETAAALGIGAPTSGSLPKKGALINIKSTTAQRQLRHHPANEIQASSTNSGTAIGSSHPTASELYISSHQASLQILRTATVSWNTPRKLTSKVISTFSSQISPRTKCRERPS